MVKASPDNAGMESRFTVGVEFDESMLKLMSDLRFFFFELIKLKLDEEWRLRIDEPLSPLGL